MPLTVHTGPALVGRDTVCILGGGGFIGHALQQALTAAGVPVRMVSRQHGVARSVPGAVEWRRCDYTQQHSLIAAMAGCAGVVHLAGGASPVRAEADPATEFDEVDITRKVLVAARQCAVRTLIYVSSGGAVYGQAQTPRINETHPLQPISVYGRVKCAIEALISAETCATRNVILRVGNAFGAEQRGSNGQGLIAVLMQAALSPQPQPVIIYGDGSTVRDYVHVDDVAQAIRAALDNDAVDGVFNVGSGVGHSVREVIAAVQALTGREIDIEWRPARASDVQCSVLDSGRITRLLNWAPAGSFAQRLAQTLSGMRD